MLNMKQIIKGLGMGRKKMLIVHSLLLTILFIAIAINISAYLTKPDEPQRWISSKNIYGIYDIKHREYTIHIENVSLLSIDKTAGTGSMIPTIPKGAIVIYKQLEGETLKVGDIIVFNAKSNNETIRIVHRIVSVGSDGKGIFYRTKGDNNGDIDPWKVRPENIVGVVVGVIW